MQEPGIEAARPAAIEAWSNRVLIHPAAAALLPLALRSGIHPNAVSLLGLGCGALAGVCYGRWQQPGFVALGFALMVGWHILDGLDGQLARASGKASALGRLIDGVCDYLVFFLVMIPIALTYADWQSTLALCLVAGGFHAVQAAGYEGARAAWLRRSGGVFVAVARPVTLPWGESGYNRIEAWLGGDGGPVDRALAAAPARLPVYLALTAPRVRALGVLCANNRTIALAVACVAGDARLYWYWEIAGLTLLGLFEGGALRRAEMAFSADRSRVNAPGLR